MSRAELAERVNANVWQTTGRHGGLDADALARYERGVVSWPNESYRTALRAVFGVSSDAHLGFYPSPRGRSAVVKPPSDLAARLQKAYVVDPGTLAGYFSDRVTGLSQTQNSRPHIPRRRRRRQRPTHRVPRHPSSRTIALIGIPSARCSLRISAQSSTVITPHRQTRGSDFNRRCSQAINATLAVR